MDPSLSAAPFLPPATASGGSWIRTVQSCQAGYYTLINASGRFKASRAVSVAVVDAQAIIHGGLLDGIADWFVTVKEALDDVRDPVSRQRLAVLPIHVETMEPSPDSIEKVTKFARETGDLRILSNVDLKIIALAYTLEAQIHGTIHLREKPPPLQFKVENDFQRRCRSYKRPNKEIKTDDSKMNIDDINASMGESRDSSDDWKPAVCRSACRKHIRRKIWDVMLEVLESTNASTAESSDLFSDGPIALDDIPSKLTPVNDGEEKNFETCNVAAKLEQMKLETVSKVVEGLKPVDFGNTKGMDGTLKMEAACKEDGSFQEDVTNFLLKHDQNNSKQCCALQFFSESNVACVTVNFVMQNVIRQIGLRLLSPGRIWSLQRRVLRCHVCKEFPEMSTTCPICLKDSILRMVYVKIGENGEILPNPCMQTSLIAKGPHHF